MIGWGAFLTGLMPGKAAIVLGTVVLALGIAFGMGWKVNGDRWELKYTQAELKHTHELNFQAEAAIAAANAYRAKEQEWERRNALAEAKHAQEIRDLQKRIAALAANGDGLRNDLRQAAAECGAASGDPVAACRAYARELGSLLAEYRAVGLEAAEAVVQHASEVRLLLESWPR